MLFFKDCRCFENVCHKKEKSHSDSTFQIGNAMSWLYAKYFLFQVQVSVKITGQVLLDDLDDAKFLT